jgi:hypothetical protein
MGGRENQSARWYQFGETEQDEVIPRATTVSV